MNASVANQEVAGASGEPPNERVFYFCGQPITESSNGHDSESEDLVSIYQIVKRSSESVNEYKEKIGDNSAKVVQGDGAPTHKKTVGETRKVPRDIKQLKQFFRELLKFLSGSESSSDDDNQNPDKKQDRADGGGGGGGDGGNEIRDKNLLKDRKDKDLKNSTEALGAASAIDSSKAILIEDLDIEELEKVPKPLGQLTFIESANGVKSPFVEVCSTGNNTFELQYTCAPLAKDKRELKDQPDLLAVIARAFLLAKISVYKRRLRLVLVEMNENLTGLGLNEGKTPEENDGKAAEDCDKLLEMYGQIGKHKSPIPFLLKRWWCLENKFVLWKERVLEKCHSDKKEEQSLGLVISQAIPAIWLGVLLALTYLWLLIPIIHAFPVIQQWQAEIFFVYCWLSLAGLFAVVALLLRKLIQSAFRVDSYCRICWACTVGLMLIILAFYLKSPIDQHSTVATLAGCGHLIILAGVVFAFLAVSLNLRTMKERIGERIEETTSDELDKILSGLTQSNASVAALNTIPATEQCVPELLLRELDEKFRTKDAISSLEKVILARKRDLTMRISHIKDHQQRARRAATAAAGGVFTGFFTFEVGESVFKYHHFQHGTDDRSMFFWFSAEAGHFGNPDLKNGNNVKPKEVTDFFNACKERHGATHSACIEIKKELTESQSGKFDAYFKQQYHNPELVTYGILLIITLTVSLLAALIGWRKPAEEQGGGHGEHH